MIILIPSGHLVQQQPDISIVVHPRLHLGLISMHAHAPRKNGGIGFSISEPYAVVELRAASAISITDERCTPFSLNELRGLVVMAETAVRDGSFKQCASITIKGAMRTHFGMGSGTAVQMAIVEGLSLMSGAAISRESIVSLSQRGGASGIGVSSYFSGGLILDLGVPSDGEISTPSSSTKNVLAPKSFLGANMPDWSLCLCMSHAIKAKTREEEIEFFLRTLPLSEGSSFRASYQALFGVYASALETNYKSFCDAIECLQSVEWKVAEWAEYGAPLRTLKSQLKDLGADCVGLSSLGPLLFCFARPKVIDKIVQSSEDIGCRVLRANPHNAGRRISRSLECAS